MRIVVEKFILGLEVVDTIIKSLRVYDSATIFFYKKKNYVFILRNRSVTKSISIKLMTADPIKGWDYCKALKKKLIQWA